MPGDEPVLGMVVLGAMLPFIALQQWYGARHSVATLTSMLDFLVWLPSTLPGSIMGLGFLYLFLGTPFLRPLYGTTFILEPVPRRSRSVVR